MQPIFRSRSTVPIRFITSIYIYIYVYSSANHRRISFRAPPVDLSTRTGECMLSINRRFEIYTESYRRSQGHRSTDHPALYNASNLSFQDETNFLFDISILRTETRFFFLVSHWKAGLLSHFRRFLRKIRRLVDLAELWRSIFDHRRGIIGFPRLSLVDSSREPNVTDHGRKWPKALDDRAMHPKIPENNRNTIAYLSPRYSFLSRTNLLDPCMPRYISRSK